MPLQQVSSPASQGPRAISRDRLSFFRNSMRLELLKEACPRISRPAALSNPDNPVSRPIIPAMQAAAASLSLIVEVVRAQSPSEFGLAFAASRGAGSSVGGRSQNRKKELPRARVRPTKEVKEYRGDFLAAWVNPSSGGEGFKRLPAPSQSLPRSCAGGAQSIQR